MSVQYILPVSLLGEYKVRKADDGMGAECIARWRLGRDEREDRPFVMFGDTLRERAGLPWLVILRYEI